MDEERREFLSSYDLLFPKDRYMYNSDCRTLKIPWLRGVSVTTAWRVLRLRVKKLPPDMEDSCEYIE